MIPSKWRLARFARRDIFGRFLDYISYLEYRLALSIRPINHISQTQTIKSRGDSLLVLLLFSDLTQAQLSFIKRAKSLGFDIWVVNNGSFPCLSDQVDHVFHRLNRGRDIGGFRDFCEMYSSGELNYKKVLWMNDSYYMKPDSFENLLDYLCLSRSEGGNKVLGLTESFQKTYHLQSYFLFFSGTEDAIRDLFADIARSTRSFLWKRTIVNYGEILLTKTILRNGFKISSYYTYLELMNKSSQISSDSELKRLIRLGVKLNPSIHFALVLSRSEVAFVKKVFVDKNPAKSQDFIPVMRELDSWNNL